MKIKMIEGGKIIREENIKVPDKKLLFARQQNRAQILTPKKGKGSYNRAKEKNFVY